MVNWGYTSLICFSYSTINGLLVILLASHENIWQALASERLKSVEPEIVGFKPEIS
jgi:hypothetical protein